MPAGRPTRSPSAIDLATARLPEATVRLLRDYLAISGPAQQAFDRIERLTAQHGIQLGKALTTLRRHAAALAALSPQAKVNFDAGFSPRLDYYTGSVFEISGANGAILASGGEYDRLLTRLGATELVAASGCAIWVDRLEREASLT
jgi:ATP phosphoribosyltransferase regulatory subunit